MSSKELAVSVRGLSKAYTIAHNAPKHTMVGEMLMHRLKNPFERPQKETFWALKDIEFDIEKGDVVGIIGRNGAGKSTLLKILSRITKPTTGQIDLYGRVGSLLEVGTGFHPELTGRENIFLNGAVLGMRKREVERQFDAIVAFAEVERFLDTPVKRYSSGMYVRLAFAVAAHLNPEILIVDEVLAVGDAEFQKKCLGKMHDVAHSGRTVLFVSHNMEAIATLTRNSLMLVGGRSLFFGKTPDAVALYTQQRAEQALIYTAIPSPDKPKVTKIEVSTTFANGMQVHGTPMNINIEITTPKAIRGMRLSVKAKNHFSHRCFYLWLYDSQIPVCRESGVYNLTCHLPKVHLYQGKHTLELSFAGHFGGDRFDDLDGLCPFEVVIQGEPREGGYEPDEGTYIEDHHWHIAHTPLAVVGKDNLPINSNLASVSAA